MEIVNIKINKLKPYEKNAKTHPKENIEAIKKSIEKYGFADPIGVWGKQNIIVEGHGRYLACKELGIDEVPCIRLDHLTDEERREYTLLHNKTTMMSDFDYELLADELGDLVLDDFELDWGLPDVLEEKEVKEDDFDCTPPEEPKAKLGDIYKLGNHRLMCGDSTREEDVSKLMNSEFADLVVTDPPYNVAIVGGSHALSPEERLKRGGLTILNDKMESGEFNSFLVNAFLNMEHSLKQGGVFYVWYASAEHINFETALNKSNLYVKEQLIWNKSSFTFGRADYHWKHEPCLYGWKDGAGHYFTDDRTQSTVIEDKGIDLKKLKKEEMLKLLQEIYSDKVSTTIINEEKPSKCDLHPTMKPIKLLARLIKNSSKTKESVLDLFGGSGSTLIACEQLNRNCYMMEFDPKYVDVIIARWEQFTGKKAEKIN